MIKIVLTLLMLSLAGTSFGEESIQLSEPSCLQPNIEFWHSIYTQYDRLDALILDAESDSITVLDRVLLPSHPKHAKRLITTIKAKFLRLGKKVRVQRGIKSRFEEGVRSYIKLRPLVERQIVEINSAISETESKIPLEISLLPHVESSYNIKARSKVGARGLWQVMPSTAKMYGLDPKNLTDPVYNTKAGLHVIMTNFNELHSWPLAITAYNHGLEGVKRAVKQVGSDNICVIIEQYRGSRFGLSSRNFYASFLAVKRILKERSLFSHP